MGFVDTVLGAETGDLMEYRHLIRHSKYKGPWGYLLCNKVGRLAQGIPWQKTVTDTMHFIEHSSVPGHKWKDMTNRQIVYNERPQKLEVNRSQITVDSSRLTSVGNLGTPTTDLITVKLLLNSVVSTPGQKFPCLDLKDFYLNTTMKKPKFTRMKLSYLPEDVIQHYNLRKIVDKDSYL